MRYIGRFAPSPTGPLHLGSLLTAVASYLDARRYGGIWLVRIEDIDPPREIAGAADQILRSLEAYELGWDGPVLYQSTHLERYRVIAEELRQSGRAYPCSCTRAMLRTRSAGDDVTGRYPGTCRYRTHHSRHTALRMIAPTEAIEFNDRLQGPQRCEIDATLGDYVIYRRDGLPAYHLAVVVDDAGQGVTHVVRGADLLQSAAPQIHLQRVLGLTSPNYCHLPIVVNAAGQKLSKQTGAAGVATQHAGAQAFEILCRLGLNPPTELLGAPPAELWAWAVPAWAPHALVDTEQIQAWPVNVAPDPPIV